jgi:MFS superfamily sulfate permease-like transporter
VAGGLSQSTVNDKAGARTPLVLIFASATLALCLLLLTGLLENLPKAVLAAVVLTAVYGLIDFPAMVRIWRISRIDFYAAAVALAGVLLLGILQGILLAALASALDLSASPHIDLATCGMLHKLNGELASQGIALRIIGAHGRVRDLLRADGVGAKVGELGRLVTLDEVLADLGK